MAFSLRIKLVPLVPVVRFLAEYTQNIVMSPSYFPVCKMKNFQYSPNYLASFQESLLG